MDPGILIPVTGYGGHERLVEMFAKEYRDLGHKVELLITNGSYVPGCVVHGIGKAGFPPRRRDAIRAIFTAWNFLRKNHKNFDLIHNFGRLIYLLPVLNKEVGKIMTYGRQITGGNINMIVKLPHQNITFTGCSENLIRRAFAQGKWVCVYNAIDFSKYDLQKLPEKNAPFIFLGRIEKVKGCHIAIAVSKATNNKLIIAGNISPLSEEKLYFENEIRPHIDGKQIIYAGTVNDAQKNELLGKCKALLFPIDIAEAFGIVMIEAMACGTPVIGFKRGSVNEVIEENITGFKVTNEKEMVEAIAKLPLINRQYCRVRAEQRFSVQIIAKQYLGLAKEFDPKFKIVIITTTQPAINPRLVKEANALSEIGFNVTVLYSHKIKWADDADKKIIANAPWEAVLIGGSPSKHHVSFFYTRIRQRFFVWLNKKGIEKYTVAEKTEARCYTEKLQWAKKMKAAFYIGHNLGSLPIVVKAAAYHKTNAGFDYEDYHRNEYALHNFRRTNRIIFLEEKYIPLVDYLSFSSLAIQEQIHADFPGFKKPMVVLLNSFPLKYAALEKKIPNNTLKLLWFSQTIGPNRGLEGLFEALLLLNDKNISLTLAGRVRNDVEELYKRKAEKIVGTVLFAGILEPHELHNFAAAHDVGLALEPSFSMNNDLALSNKIFTYLMAGNAIIYSETTAQKKFYDESKTGQYFKPGDVQGLANCISYYKNAENLTKQKEYNLLLAKEKYNWETESVKLVNLFEKAILPEVS